MNEFAVYRDAQSHCCLRVREHEGQVEFIAVVEEGGSLYIDIFTVKEREFYIEYTTHLDTYPVKRAAQHYLNPLTAAITVSPRARKVLESIVTNHKEPLAMSDTAVTKTAAKGKAPTKDKAESNVAATKEASIKNTGSKPEVAPVVKDTSDGKVTKEKKGTWDAKETASEQNRAVQEKLVKQHKQVKEKAVKKEAAAAKRAAKKAANPTQPKEEKAMSVATATKKSVAPAKKAAAKKTAPAAKKVTKKAAPAKAAPKAAPKSAKKANGGRTSYADKKIKGLVKNAEDAGLRAGSVRAAMLNAVLKAKNTDEVIGKEINVGKDRVVIAGNNIAGMLARGHISLS